MAKTSGRSGGADDLSQEYVAHQAAVSIEQFEASLDAILGFVAQFRPVDQHTRILEVGAGIGWIEVICAQRGLDCSAIELNPLFREAALELAAEHGVEIDIQLGSIETTDLGKERYDVIIATSVFEHVPQYGRGLARIYEALRTGGVFYFYSTNKFSLRSGEYPEVPLYGWLPYVIRRRIRVSRQGPDIVGSSGMDFNQFTYWGLSRQLKSLGYSQVLDRFEFLPRRRKSLRRSLAMSLIKSSPVLRFLARTFDTGTTFICVK
jgi:SAM-dependent methyltransferase